jgi:hypothetical protein
MNQPHSSEFPQGDPDPDDPVLARAGARLRERTGSLSVSAIEASVLRRRNRRLKVVAGAAFAVVAVLAGVNVAGWSGDANDTAVPASSAATPEERSDAEILLASLDDQPVDPTKVQLVSSVSTFADCDALIGDLRSVGAEHVGSRGFGASHAGLMTGDFDESGRAAFSPAPNSQANSGAGGAGAGTTLGTNVQIAGVDELDHVKAVGTLIYDLDGEGNLRITDASSLEVLSSVDVTPAPLGGDDDTATAQQLLVAEHRAVVFGTETEVSEPVEGDPTPPSRCRTRRPRRPSPLSSRSPSSTPPMSPSPS